jgi:hypothetical protein
MTSAKSLFQATQKVVYRGQDFTVLGFQGDNWVRITNNSVGKVGFCVHKDVLIQTEVKVQPVSLKKLNPSVEKARELVKFAVDYKSLYFQLKQSGYLQNDMRTWLAEQNRRGQHFGLIKSMVIAKIAKIIRSKEMH